MGGDKPAKEQRGVSWGQLNELFGTSKAAGAELGAAGKVEKAKGLSQLDDVTNYFNTLFRGNRQETAQAIAPATNAAINAADAAKRQQATMGTGRTGGTVAVNQQIDENTRQQIDTLLAGVKPEAARALTSIGEFQAGIGETDISNMLASLGIGVSASGVSGGQSTQAQAAAQQAQAMLWAALISGASDVASAGVAKCWIAEAIWGVGDLRTILVRAWLNGLYADTLIGGIVMSAYGLFGRKFALWVKASPLLRSAMKPLFNVALRKAALVLAGRQ